MEASINFRSSGPCFSRNTFLQPRNEPIVTQKVFFPRAKYAQSGVNGSFSVRLVPPALLAAEKEEARAVLTLFLKKQGLSTALAARTTNKSDAFVDHLVSKLHSIYKSRYLAGRELTTLEIRDALIPYLELLHEEYESILVDIVENFPDPPPAKEKIEENVRKPIEENGQKQPVTARVSDISPTGIALPPDHVKYLLELGMEPQAIKQIVRQFPSFSYYGVDSKIRPLVKFLLDLGVPKKHIPSILRKRPQLCAISLSENLIPTMKLLEELGVDKEQWAKVIYRFPPLLTLSQKKLKATTDFLYEMGLSAENVGKVLTRCPNITSYSIKNKLRPTADYFRSLGIDVECILRRSPSNFGLSIESSLKPVTNFFLEKGYTSGELATMISRFATLYTFNLPLNIMPKWDFFETTVYPKSELIKFPNYFGYSLEDRIKPRYAIMRQCGVKLLLNQMLSLSEANFQIVLEKKMQKKIGD